MWCAIGGSISGLMEPFNNGFMIASAMIHQPIAITPAAPSTRRALLPPFSKLSAHAMATQKTGRQSFVAAILQNLHLLRTRAFRIAPVQQTQATICHWWWNVTYYHRDKAVGRLQIRDLCRSEQ